MKVNNNRWDKASQNNKAEIRQQKDIKKYGKVIRREYRLVDGKKVQFNNKYSFLAMPEPSNRIKEMSTDELKKNLGDIKNICSNGGWTIWNSVRQGFLERELKKRGIENYKWYEDKKVAPLVIKEEQKRLKDYKEIFSEIDKVFSNN